MCLELKEVRLYKVLRADYRSPYYNTQWPREGWMHAERPMIITEEERARRQVSEGLHFYTDMTFGIHLGEIVVECWAEPLAWNGHEAVAERCRVGKLLFGHEFVRLADKLDLSVGCGCFFKDGESRDWKELLQYKEFKRYYADWENGYWKSVVNNHTTREWK